MQYLFVSAIRWNYANKTPNARNMTTIEIKTVFLSSFGRLPKKQLV